MCSSHIRRTDLLKHSWVDCSRIAEKYGAQKCHGNFSFTHGNFNFAHRQFQFVLGNFNLLTPISICSQQPFQFIYGNFNLLAAVSILLTAISIYSQQFLLFHGNAHGIFRLAHHLSKLLRPTVATKGQNANSKVDT